MAPSEDQAVTNFREYLRIKSVQPKPDYDGCVKFLRKMGEEIGLKCRVVEAVAGKPIVILTWEGLEPKLPSVLLNSHTDVVPVFPEKWTHDPFSAFKDSAGNIYARGSQDMKCVGMQYIEAVRRLTTQGIRLKRTIHLTFVPDEEIGGFDGMKEFIEMDEFKKLNIGFSLDEGIASPNEEFMLYNAERSIWHLHFHVTGSAGHGSLLLENTVGEKIRILVDHLMDFRAKEKARLAANPNLVIGDVTTVNLTQLKGGVQSNVVPPEMTVTFDIRLAPSQSPAELDAWIAKVIEKAGGGISITYEQKQPQIAPTSLGKDNPWWTAFKSAADKLNLKLKIATFPGGTDSRYLRGIGLPALGFSPMNHTPVLLHDNDEFLNEKVFLKGIDIYVNIIEAVANVSAK